MYISVLLPWLVPTHESGWYHVVEHLEGLVISLLFVDNGRILMFTKLKGHLHLMERVLFVANRYKSMS